MKNNPDYIPKAKSSSKIARPLTGNAPGTAFCEVSKTSTAVCEVSERGLNEYGAKPSPKVEGNAGLSEDLLCIPNAPWRRFWREVCITALELGVLELGILELGGDAEEGPRAK